MVPEPSVPKIAAISRRQHGQLRVACRDLELKLLRVTPRPHELLVGVGIVVRARGGKPPLGEGDIDLKNELDLAALDEIENGLAALLLDEQYFIEGGIEPQRSYSSRSERRLRISSSTTRLRSTRAVNRACQGVW